MSITILKPKAERKHRLRVKEVQLPLATSEILGSGIDVTALPEGHMCCIKCGKHKFEAWLYGDNHRLEMGCMECNQSYRLLFPLDIDLGVFGGNGRFSCLRRKNQQFIHKEKGMILIQNSGFICIGCEACNTQIQINVRKTQHGLIIPDA